ncbi:transposase, partial [Anaerobium acetethylicum]
GTEFLRLFLRHILPKGFNRVRFSGFLTNSQKTKKLKLIHRLRNTIYKGNPVKELKTADLMMLLFQRDICHCSKCSGTLIHLPRGVPLTALQF